MKKKTGAADQVSEKRDAGTTPIEKKHEVQQSNDEHIDQDFPGFPHNPSTEKEIKNRKDKGAGTSDE